GRGAGGRRRRRGPKDVESTLQVSENQRVPPPPPPQILRSCDAAMREVRGGSSACSGSSVEGGGRGRLENSKRNASEIDQKKPLARGGLAKGGLESTRMNTKAPPIPCHPFVKWVPI